MQEFQYIQDVLKEFYTPAIVNQVYSKAPLWAIMKKTKKGVAGKRVVIPVTLAFSEAVGARAQNNYDLMAAQRSTFDQAYITQKRNYGRVMVDGFSIAASKGKGGWVDILTLETKNVSKAFALEIDRQTWGDGRGIYAVQDGAISGQDITVKDAGGITGDTPKTKFIRKGQVMDIYNSTGTKHADSVVVASIAGDVVTFTGDVSACVTGDFLLAEDTWETNNGLGSGVMMGINGIANTANKPGGTADFEGINRSNEALWRAYVAGSIGALTETKIQEVIDAVEDRTDGENPTIILTTKTVRNYLIDLVKADRVVETMKLKAGWKAIRYIGGEVELPLLSHKSAPAGYMYFAAMAHIKFYALKALTWDNKGGGIVKPVAGKDAYEAWFKMYGNIGTDCSNAFGVAPGITAPA